MQFLRRVIQLIEPLCTQRLPRYKNYERLIVLSLHVNNLLYGRVRPNSVNGDVILKHLYSHDGPLVLVAGSQRANETERYRDRSKMHHER
jgi:hypothetical protein